MSKTIWLLLIISWQAQAQQESTKDEPYKFECPKSVPLEYESMTKNELLEEYCYSLTVDTMYFGEQVRHAEKLMRYMMSSDSSGMSRYMKESERKIQEIEANQECAQHYMDKSLATLDEQFNIKTIENTYDDDEKYGFVLIDHNSGEKIRCAEFPWKQN